MSWNSKLKLFSIFVLFVQICIPFTEAFWGNWGTWSPCTTTCGPGITSRQRSCLFGQCIGSSVIHKTCMESVCPNGDEGHSWSDWGHWSECTQTCGGGSRQRTRTCSTGTESDCCEHDTEESCQLEHTQTRECLNNDCIGTWSDWRSWGGCNATCGDGTQTRSRDCEPVESVCMGGGQQIRACYVQCPDSQGLKTGTENIKSCSDLTENPCYNGGTCVDTENGVTCQCQGDWRGQACNSLCLNANNRLSCDNMRGMFHDCNDCHRFIICSRAGSMLPITCTGNRIWTGNGCSEAGEDGVSCVENTSTDNPVIKLR